MHNLQKPIVGTLVQGYPPPLPDYKCGLPELVSQDVSRCTQPSLCSTGKLGFDPDICNNKLKLSGYVEEAYLTTVPKVPKNPVAGFSKMAE